MKKLGLFLFYFNLVATIFAQKADLDSLQKVIEQMPTDTHKVNASIDLLNRMYREGKSKEGLIFGKKMMALAQQLNFPRAEATIANRLGTIITNMGENPKEALKYHEQALKIRQENQDLYGMGISYNNIGNVYRDMALDSKAIDYYLESAKICEQINDQEGLAYAYKNIGIVYEYQGWYDRALEYHLRALRIREKISMDSRISSFIFNVGISYSRHKKYDSALVYLQKALEIAQEAGFELQDEILIEIGEAFYLKNQLQNAFQYYTKALQKAQEFGKSKIISEALSQIVRICVKTKNEQNAQKFLIMHQKLLDSIDYKRGRLEFYYESYLLDSLKNNELSALRFFRKYSLLKDSIYNEKSAENLQKNLGAIEILQKESEIRLQQAKSEFRNSIFKGIIVFLILSSLGLSFTILTKQKDNKRLQKQQQEIEEKNKELLVINEEMTQHQEEITAQRNQISSQKNELLEVNQHIQASIRSALTIQQALLPSQKMLDEFLTEYFLLYLPKDVVSGDFYWINFIDNKKIIALADCTGHGVSGAFMSLIGINLLNKIIYANKITQPALVLELLQNEIITILRQDENKNKDGMDIAILVMEEKDQLHVSFAGAKRPLVYFDQNVNIINGTRKSIGGKQNIHKSFEQKNLILPRQTIFYLFSDGFADQNDAARRRFSDAKFMSLLSENTDKDLKKQGEILHQVFLEYTKGTTQRDDILVLGFRA